MGFAATAGRAGWATTTTDARETAVSLKPRVLPFLACDLTRFVDDDVHHRPGAIFHRDMLFALSYDSRDEAPAPFFLNTFDCLSTWRLLASCAHCRASRTSPPLLSRTWRQARGQKQSVRPPSASRTRVQIALPSETDNTEKSEVQRRREKNVERSEQAQHGVSLYGGLSRK